MIEQIEQEVFDPRPAARARAWAYAVDALALAHVGYPFETAPEPVIAALCQEHPERRESLHRWFLERPCAAFERAYSRLWHHAEVDVQCAAMASLWRWDTPARYPFVTRFRDELTARLRANEDAIAFLAGLLLATMFHREDAWAVAIQAAQRHAEGALIREAVSLRLLPIPERHLRGHGALMFGAGWSHGPTPPPRDSAAPTPSLLDVRRAMQVAEAHDDARWARVDVAFFTELLAMHLEHDPHNHLLWPDTPRARQVLAEARALLD